MNEFNEYICEVFSVAGNIVIKPLMGLIGAGNNPMVGMTVACAVAVEESFKK